MSASTSCTATFNSENPLTAKIAVFRPSASQWFLDSNGNGIFDSCTIDTCVTGYGGNAMLPVVAGWDGRSFRTNTGNWHLDNGNGKWNACSSTGDTCVTTYGAPGSFPVVKALSSEKLVPGPFQPQVTTRSRGKNVITLDVWNFDIDGDGNVDKCNIDQCENLGQVGDLPVTGDWNGTGLGKIGIFTPANGEWRLALNGNGRWDGSTVDRLRHFGLPADLLVAGDWDGTGKVRIGV
jgi:hypothetical protein